MGNQPLASTVHIDYALTNISLAYIQSADQFVASKVFPIVGVDNQSNKYFTYTKADWFRDEAALRAPATESAGSGFNMSTASYNCDVFAVHKDVPDQILKNADMAVNVEADAARFVAQRMLLRREKQWITDAFATSIWGTDVVGNTASPRWDIYTTSNPIADVETGRKTILKNTGFLPNTLVLGYDVFSALLNHPQFVDRIKYTNSDAVDMGLIARLFRVDKVLVASAVENTGLEGETASYSFAAGKNALLCYVAPQPGLLTPSAGYTFAWNGVSDGSYDVMGTTRFYIPEKRAMRIESQMAWDNKIVATDLGYFFSAYVS